AVAVPLMDGCVCEVVDPSAGDTMLTVGTVVSTTNMFCVMAELVAASLAVAVTVCEPSVKVVGMGSVQRPEESATNIVGEPPSIPTLTLLPGSAVPCTVCMAMLVVSPLAGSVMPTMGGTVSTVKVDVAEPVIPLAVADAMMVCRPSVSTGTMPLGTVQ